MLTICVLCAGTAYSPIYFCMVPVTLLWVLMCMHVEWGIG